MSFEGNILSNLGSALSGITEKNGYKTNVAMVVQSPPMIIAAVEDKPAIVFSSPNIVETEDYFGGKRIDFQIMLHAYIAAQPDAWSVVWDFREDIERLLTNWTLNLDTLIGPSRIWHGGGQDMIAIIEMQPAAIHQRIVIGLSPTSLQPSLSLRIPNM